MKRIVEVAYQSKNEYVGEFTRKLLDLEAIKQYVGRKEVLNIVRGIADKEARGVLQN